MANDENLNPPWQKGQSGNPAGKPKGARNRQTIVREWLETDAVDGEGGTRADQMTRAMIRKAESGDVGAFKELLDSSYGKLTEKSETKHSFTQMGSVVKGEGDSDQKEISFDVGKDVKIIEGEVNE